MCLWQANYIQNIADAQDSVGNIPDVVPCVMRADHLARGRGMARVGEGGRAGEASKCGRVHVCVFVSLRSAHSLWLALSSPIPAPVSFYRYGGDPGDPSWSAAFPQNLYVRYAYDGDVTTAATFWPQLSLYWQNVANQVRLVVAAVVC